MATLTHYRFGVRALKQVIDVLRKRRTASTCNGEHDCGAEQFDHIEEPENDVIGERITIYPSVLGRID